MNSNNKIKMQIWSIIYDCRERPNCTLSVCILCVHCRPFRLLDCFFFQALRLSSLQISKKFLWNSKFLRISSASYSQLLWAADSVIRRVIRRVIQSSVWPDWALQVFEEPVRCGHDWLITGIASSTIRTDWYSTWRWTWYSLAGMDRIIWTPYVWLCVER